LGMSSKSRTSHKLEKMDLTYREILIALGAKDESDAFRILGVKVRDGEYIYKDKGYSQLQAVVLLAFNDQVNSGEIKIHDSNPPAPDPKSISIEMPKLKIGKAITQSAKRMFTSWEAGQHERAIDSFIQMLEGFDAEEFALATAAAIDFAVNMSQETGINLYDPRAALLQDPDVALMLSKQALTDRTNENFSTVAPIMIWVHSLRAMQYPPLRMKGRKLWQQLSRAFPYVDKAASDFAALSGQQLNISMNGEYPRGLTPTPAD